MCKLSLLIALLAVGCDWPTVPQGTIPFAAPAYYATLWGYVEDCSGRTGDLSRIDWWEASGPDVPCHTRKPYHCVGSWQPPHTITLGRGAREDDRIVMHEMLHDLLDGPREGDPHPAIFTACDVALGTR